MFKNQLSILFNSNVQIQLKRSLAAAPKGGASFSGGKLGGGVSSKNLVKILNFLKYKNNFS